MEVVKRLAQCDTACDWQSRDSNTGLPYGKGSAPSAKPQISHKDYNVGGGISHPRTLNTSVLPLPARTFSSRNNPFCVRESRGVSAGMREATLSPEDAVQGSRTHGASWGSNLEEEEPQKRVFFARKKPQGLW